MSSDKTEQPTAKKKKDERKKGNIAKSREISNAFTLIAAVLCIYIMTNKTIKNLKEFIVNYLAIDFSINLTNKTYNQLFINGLFTFMKIFLPMGLIILSFGVISNIIQSGFIFSKESLKPKFSKLNPVNGFKNMFSQKAFVTFFKNTVLLILLSYIGYTFVKKNYFEILKIGDIYFPYLIYSIFETVKKLLNIAIMIAVVIGVSDFIYQIYSYKKEMKMTKQEVKEEYKQAEGNPQIKSQIKQKQRQLSSQRMIQNAKDATVIITNPTHISIAIRYDRDTDSAPIVIAKGADILAQKIREIAKENNIPIVENKPLARMIYKEVDIEQEIPAAMYQAIAEVLVAVYKIKNRYKANK